MKIGIFTAMEKEAQSFLSQTTAKQKVGAFTVYTLNLANHEAYLCCPPEVGEISASAACQLLISQYHVDLIINFGVVGALTEKMSVATTVLVGSVVHYDFDISVLDKVPVGRYLCFDDVAVPCDLSLINRALSLSQMPVVRCASADKFVDAPDQKAALNANFGAEICDMESAGVLFTCKHNQIPCLLVKCVSDSLTGGYGEYSQNARKAASDFFAFASRLAERL